MALAPQKCILEQNCQLLIPLKFGSAVFRVLTEMKIWCCPLWKIRKMALAPQKCILEQNCQLLTPLKFGSAVFRVLTEMKIWCCPLWKIRKMALTNSPKMHPRAKRCWTCMYEPACVILTLLDIYIVLLYSAENFFGPILRRWKREKYFSMRMRYSHNATEFCFLWKK